MTKFHGLIQHSFALRLRDAHQPFDGRSTRESVAERFEVRAEDGVAFCLRELDGNVDSKSATWASRYSPLVEAELTTVRARPVEFLEPERDAGYRGCENWPTALSWAKPQQPGEHGGRCGQRGLLRPRMIFSEYEEKWGAVSENDFLIDDCTSGNGPDRAQCVTLALLEAIAFRRSQLFGLATANRFVNVMLPSALLKYAGEGYCGENVSEANPRDLILQPLLSLVRDGRDRRKFRQMYSLAFFVIPVERDTECAREMSKCEITSLVNAGWSLADTVPENLVPRYDVSNQFREYVTRLASPEVETLLDLAGSSEALSLRKVIEIVAFGVALRMTQGSTGEASTVTKRRVGDDVVTALGTARLSAAVLVDPELKPKAIRTPIKKRDPPGSLDDLMTTLASEVRSPEWTARTRRKYQLDRPLVDEADYAIGLLPSNRCLFVTNVCKTNCKSPEPLLSQVAAVTYMTIGAATAIGTMRAIDRELERLEHEDPAKIAEIDAEIATDLHEIYDLDIARETYRQLYRRLRNRLGITSDYKTLQDKMQTLYRATSTIHDDREQKQLAWLTAAIVALSVLILIVGVVAASK